MKFLIILMYYDRPRMVRTALESISAQGYYTDAGYDNFEVAFIDDGSITPGKQIADQFDFDNIKYYNTFDSTEQKLDQGGSMFGKLVNQAIDESTADIGLMLCDDDALFLGALQGLSNFYQNHPFIHYSYGHVKTYDPMRVKSWAEIEGSTDTFLNNHVLPINPYCQVDASQVSWRMDMFKAADIKFPYPLTYALDAHVYAQMYEAFGPCPYNNMYVQYKGVFHDQLGTRKDPYKPLDREI